MATLRPSAPASSGDAGRAAREVHGSGAVDALARLGLASRGLVWLVVGLLAVSVLRGGQARTDQAGALREIADRPLGEVLLVVLVVGFLGYALWQGLSAAVGHRHAAGGSRLTERAESAGRAVVYVALAVSVVRLLAGGQRSGGDATPSLTARLMEQPGGRWLVGLVGLAVVAAGVVFVVRALKGEHAKKIESWKVPDGRGRLALRLGTVGLVGRGLVLGLIGSFLVGAAVQADPREARGLDAALQTLAQQSHGKAMLGVAAVGLLAYALWSFVEAAFHRHR